jgi:methyltransferase family protein
MTPSDVALGSRPTVEQRVAALDTTLFDHIDTETTGDDRTSLLAIQDALARRLGTFSYLEIGSHLGGTLQAMLADDRCARITSIDPRPASQPDDRGLVFRYDDNSTQRMLALLARVPHGNLRKLQTIEASTENIAAGGLARADLSFIDGEHTRRAALRDARFCRAVMQGAGVVVFHDRHVIEPAVQDFLAETPGMLVAYPLRTSLLVVELGRGFALRGERSIRAQLAGPPAAVWVAAGRMHATHTLLAVARATRRARMGSLRTVGAGQGSGFSVRRRVAQRRERPT